MFFVKEGTHLVELGVLRVGFGELRNLWTLVTKVYRLVTTVICGLK